MSQPTYEAAVYSRTVKYRNHNGQDKEQTLYFALDPIQLLRVMAGANLKVSKSNNPARAGREEISEDDQLRMLQELAARAAGWPSDDGESWAPYENFKNEVAGKAFITQLAASDGDRREFAEKVIMDPFRSFVMFAEADPSNTAKDVQEFKVLLDQIEKLFQMPEKTEESVEDRRARLQAEMAALELPSDD